MKHSSGAISEIARPEKRFTLRNTAKLRRSNFRQPLRGSYRLGPRNGPTRMLLHGLWRVKTRSGTFTLDDKGGEDNFIKVLQASGIYFQLVRLMGSGLMRRWTKRRKYEFSEERMWSGKRGTVTLVA